MREAHLSRLVVSRTAKHLRQAALVISAVACLIVSIMSVFEWQYQRAREEFLDNPLVHYVDVSVRLGDQGSVHLGWDDIAIITQAAQDHARGGFRIAPLFGGLPISVSLPENQWTTVFVYGVPEGGAWVLGTDHLEPGVGYAANGETTTLNLRVPHLTAVGPRDWELSGGAPYDLPTVPLPEGAPVAQRGLTLNNVVFVDEATFAVICPLMLGEPWEVVRSQIGPDNAWHLDLMPQIYLYLDRLSDVAPVAESLRPDGYLPVYVLEAFRNIPETLRSGFWAGLSVAVLALVSGTTLSVILTRSYLRLSHRDMGILKHMGCPAPRVRRVYARPIRDLLFMAGAVSAGLAITLGLVMGLDWWFTVLNTAVPAVLVGAVTLWALTLETPRHTGLPVLELLKLNREFE